MNTNDGTPTIDELDNPKDPLNEANPVPLYPEKGYTINVHDHGFVRYIGHFGDDVDICEAARISYKAPSKGPEADKKLLTYLLRNKHTSPFEMVKIKFNIKMPIFVWRQYIRHRFQNFADPMDHENMNEVSARYTELPDNFFIPVRWRTQDAKNKQSSLDNMADNKWHADLHFKAKDFYGRAYAFYQEMLQAGVAREQARIFLPIGIYTEFYSCWDLNNLLKFFALRDDPHAQGEHQDYAKAMKQIAARCFPWTLEIYEQLQKENQKT